MADVMQAKLNVSLYDNALTPEKDDYVAKVQLNGTLSNEEIAKDIVSQRSEFRYDTILNILNMGSEIKRNRLATGYAVNDGVFQMYPSVYGRFVGASAQFDSKTHSVGVTAVPALPLRKAMLNTKVVVQGLATTGPVINKVTDVYSQSDNQMITPGKGLKIMGQRLKVGGDNPGTGIYFIDSNDSTQRIRVDDRDIIENNPSQLTITVPALVMGSYFLEVVTQLSKGVETLKEPRSYRFDIPLMVS